MFKLVLDNFSIGLIDESVISKMGLARLKPVGGNIFTISPCPATDLNWIQFRPKSIINKLRGRIKLHSDPYLEAPITRVYHWRDVDGINYPLAFFSRTESTSAAITLIEKTSSEISFTPLTLTGIASGWNPSESDPIDVTSYAGSAIMTYGKPDLPLLAYSGGSNIIPMESGPIGAKTVCSMGSYLLAGNIVEDSVRQSARLRWCEALNPSSWPVWNYIDLEPGDGDEITALWPLQNMVVAFKRNKVYLVRYVGGSLEFDWVRLGTSIGTVGSNSLTEVDNILYFISPAGFYMFDGSSAPKPIDEYIAYRTQNLNDDIEKCFEVEYLEPDMIIYNVATGGSSHKDTLFIYHLKDRFWTCVSLEASSFGYLNFGVEERYIDLPNPYSSYDKKIEDAKGSQDPRLVCGSYDGMLYAFDEGSDDLDNAINAYWISPWIDFGVPDKNKKITRLHIFVDPTTTSHTITVYCYADWNLGTPIAILPFNTQSSSRDVVERKLDTLFSCRSLKLKIVSNEIMGTLGIHRIEIDFQIKGGTLPYYA